MRSEKEETLNWEDVLHEEEKGGGDGGGWRWRWGR